MRSLKKYLIGGVVGVAGWGCIPPTPSAVPLTEPPVTEYPVDDPIIDETPQDPFLGDGNTTPDPPVGDGGSGDGDSQQGEDINHAPKTGDMNVNVLEETPLGIVLNGTDEDGDDLTFRVTSSSSHGEVVLDGNVATYTPEIDFFGEDGFWFRTNDGEFDSNSSKVTINVANVNDPPIVSANTLEAIVRGTDPKAVYMYGSDVDRDDLTFLVVNEPQYGTAVITDTNKLTYQLVDVDFVGMDTVSFKASDGIALSESLQITFDVRLDWGYEWNVRNLTNSLSSRMWVTYAPRNFDPTQGIFPSVESIRDDLELLREEGFTGLITYDVESTLKEVPRIAKEVGFASVITGVWFTNNGGLIQDAIDVGEYSNGYCIGNELLGQNGGYTLEDLLAAGRTLRNGTKKPVSTTEQFEDYFENPDLVGFGEFLLPNVHPYWLNIKDPIQAAARVAEVYGQLENIAGEKQILIKETGMPTSGDPEVSELTQLEFFYELLYNENHAGIAFSFFEAFDQPWKDWAPVEPYWGLHTSTGEKKMFIFGFTPPPPVGYSDCLSQDSNIFLEVNYAGFGGLRLRTTDRNHLADDCPDFDIFEGHDGGYGDTLEMRSINGGVHLLWSYNNLGHVFVGPGWTGETNRRIGIGDNLEDFLRAYPESVECGESVMYDYEGGHRRWGTTFDDFYGLYAEFDENQEVLGLCITSRAHQVENCEVWLWSYRMDLLP
ncbi:MAG: Ig-like domain-containing protein [Candidatus Woesearchaeota archaeon]